MSENPAHAPGSTVLITGTSSGIGLATALAAARQGWTVVATMRDLGKAGPLKESAAAAGVELDLRPLDVTDGAAVHGVVESVMEDYGRLDAVVNNAGAAQIGTVENMAMDEFRAALEVNFFGVVQVTRSAMPYLRESGGRLVTVSSVGGAVGQPFNEAYCAAKFAVEGFLESLHPVAASVGVAVSVVEPGAVASEFVNNAGVDLAVMIADAGAYMAPLEAYLQRTMSQFSTGAQSPEEVGGIIASLLGAQEPPFRVQTSDWARDFVGTKLKDVDGSRVTGMTAGWVGL